MENFIKELIVLDERAANITSKADRDLKNLDKVIESKKAEILKSINEACEKEFYNIRADKELRLKRAMVEMDSGSEKNLKSMEAEFERNFGKWEDEIISNAIGNEGVV